MSIPAQVVRALQRLLPALALMLLLCGGGMPSPPQRWSIEDTTGARWALLLFAQEDPAFPEGWRLRLQALTPELQPAHDRALLLDDGSQQQWTLANRSQELVPAGSTELPSTTAQFDAEELQPPPLGYVPLQLHVPVIAGKAHPQGWRDITLSPAITQVLAELAHSDTPVRASDHNLWRPQ